MHSLSVYGKASANLLTGQAVHYNSFTDLWEVATGSSYINGMALENIAAGETGPICRDGVAQVPYIGGIVPIAPGQELYFDESTFLLTTSETRLIAGYTLNFTGTAGDTMQLLFQPAAAQSLFPFAFTRSGAGTAISNRYNIDGIDFNDAQSTGVGKWAFALPRGAKPMTNVSIVVHYTTTALGNQCVIDIAYAAHPATFAGTTWNTAPTALNGQTIPGAGVADQKKRFRAFPPTTNTLLWDASFFSLSITRQGNAAGDTNTGILWIATVELILTDQ